MATFEDKSKIWFFTHDNSELLCKCVLEVRRIYDHLDTVNNENYIKTCRPVYVGYEVLRFEGAV